MKSYAPACARARSKGHAPDAVEAVAPEASRIRFASSWIQRVTSVSAGPPLGGLYLKPPSSGGLCDGVTTIPSARPVVPAPVRDEDRERQRRRRRVAVLRHRPARRRRSATSTSSAVRQAGSESACVSRPMNSGPCVPLRRPVAADRLGRGQDVGLVERGPERGPAVAGRAERDTLRRVGRVRAGSRRTRGGARARPRARTGGRAGRRAGAGSSGPRGRGRWRGSTRSRYRRGRPGRGRAGYRSASASRGVPCVDRPTLRTMRATRASTSYGARPSPSLFGGRMQGPAMTGRDWRFSHGDRDVRSRVQDLRRRHRRHGPQPRDRRRRVHGPRRPVGLRQDDQPADDRRPRGDHRGRRSGSATGSSTTSPPRIATSRWSSRATRSTRTCRSATTWPSASSCARSPRPRSRSGSTRPPASSSSRSCSTASRRSSPAASASASRSAARSSASPRCS